MRSMFRLGSLIVLMLVPWILYQRLYDPPGNRLIKMHFAGVVEPDNRGVVESLVASYRSQSFGVHLLTRWNNLTEAPFRGFAIPRNIGALSDYIRETNFFSLFPMLGSTLLGLIFIILGAIRRRRFRVSGIYEWSLYLLGTYLVWAISFFSPDSTVLHQGTYLLPLMATVIFVIAIGECLGMAALIVLLSLRVILFFCGTLVFPIAYTVHSIPFIVLALVFLWRVVVCLWRMSNQVCVTLKTSSLSKSS